MKRSSGQVPVFIILALIVLTLSGIRTISTPKIWSHIAAGQAMAEKNALLADSLDPFCFTTEGQKWISTTPLYDRLMYSMADAPAAITLFHVAIALAAFLLLLPVAKKWGNSLSAAVALFLCSIMLMPMFNPAPIFFGMFFYALFLLLLQPGPKKPVRWAILIPAQILWTSMHPTFILGPIMCLLAAFQSSLKAKGQKISTDGAKEYFLLTLVTLLVTIINPAGLKLHIYLVQHAAALMLPAAQTFISPFSLQFQQPLMRQLLTITLFLGAGGLITLKKQLPLVITTLAMVSAFFMIRSLHFTVLFVYLAFPFLVLSLQAIGEAIEHTIEPLLGDNGHLLKKGVQALLVIFLALEAWSTINNSAYAKTGSASSFGLGLQEKSFPTGIDEIVNHRSFPKKILNLPYDGAYLSYKFPEKQFYCDQRGDLFSVDKYRDLLGAITMDAEKWNALQISDMPQALILNCFSSESAPVLRTFLNREWKMVYFDGSYAILLSPSKRYDRLVKTAQTKKAGLKSLTAELAAYRNASPGIMHPANSPRLIGAGTAYLALNRFEEAEAVYATLLNATPSMRSAWFGYGQALLGLKQAQKAIPVLEHAAKIMPKNGFTLLSLQRAYQLTGNSEQAKRIQLELEKHFKPVE